MSHARRSGHSFLRHLHLGVWLKDSRDPDYAVGKLIAPSRLSHRSGSAS